MSKQKKIVEVPVTSEERIEEMRVKRMTFVCLLMMIVKGGPGEIDLFLKGQTAEAIRDYAAIWDECAKDPVGVIFNRPAFELMAQIKDVVKD